MFLWDWRTGYNFQRIQAPVQPGSIDSEAGIFAMTFDKSGSRLFSCEADKTIKVYKEDETAVSETALFWFRPHQSWCGSVSEFRKGIGSQVEVIWTTRHELLRAFSGRVRL